MPVHIAGGTSKGRAVSTGDIVPENTEVSLGTITQPFKELFLSENSLHIGEAVMSSSSGKIELPMGSTIGSMTPGAIRVHGKLMSTSDLPTPHANIRGESYVIDRN